MIPPCDNCTPPSWICPSCKVNCPKKRRQSKEVSEFAQKKIKRHRTSYSQNHSMARMLESEVNLESPQLLDAIGDHAYRRVQIFYYQAHTYFNEKCTIELGKTALQHGRSNCEGTSAAHSSLLPNLVDSKMILNRDSYFYHAMNSTVELPYSVNEYDTVIERSLRSKAIEILNQVSNEGLHPYRGLEKLVELMDVFFRRSEDEILIKIKKLQKIERLENKLASYEKAFTPDCVTPYIVTLKKVQKVYKKVKRLNQYSVSTKLNGRLPWQRTFSTRNATYYDIRAMIDRNQGWSPKPMAPIFKKLKESLTILKVQKKHTIVPPLELLSGKMVNGVLVPLTEEELMREKPIPTQ